MIDTVILAVPRTRVRSIKLYSREVEDWNLQARTNTYSKYVKNPSAKDQENGTYIPRLTGIHRIGATQEWESTVYVEFSVPKLIFGDNLNELEESHFEEVIATLEKRLMLLGIRISIEDLRQASVKAVHYSKNIRLTGGYTAQYVIRELSRLNPNKRFDLTRATFTNDGQSLQIYTVAHSFVIYDKIADLAKGKRRAIDKDQTSDQMSLFAEYKGKDDILRLEVRLSQKRKLNALFKQLGYESNPTFKDVFSLEKSQKVVRQYWDTLIGKYGISVLSHASNPKDLLSQVLIARHGINGKTAVYLTGLLLLARDENGIRELRAMLTNSMDVRTWYRVATDVREIGSDLGKLRLREWYEQVEKALTTYQPMRLACK